MAKPVTKVVRKDNSAEAKKARKAAKLERNKNKGKINAKAKRDYKSLSPKKKKAHLERVVWRKAKAHGATDAEADKAVLIYKKRRQNRNAGKHAAEQRRQATGLQKQVRGQIKQKAATISASHKKALQKIRTAKVPAATKSKMRAAEKQRYAKERGQLAKERNKAVKSHASRLTKIKTLAQKHGPIKLSSLISNYSKRTLGQKGKRLATVGPTAAKTKTGGAAKKPAAAKKTTAKKGAGSEIAAIADKAFTVKGKPGRKKAAAAPAAAEAPKAKRAYNKKPKADAPAAEAPKAKRAYNKKPKADAPAAEAPKAKRAYNRKPKADAAPAAEVKTKRKYTKKAKPEAAAEAPKAKRAYNRKPKAEAPAAEAPKAKRAYNKKPKADAAPVAKGEKKTAPKAAAKNPTKKVTAPKAAPAKATPAKGEKAPKPKAAAKNPTKKVEAKTAKQAPAKGGAKAKTGAAIPQKKTTGGNRRANLG